MGHQRTNALSGRVLDVFIVVITWIAIVLQTIESENIANSYSYFTILTNLLIAVSLTITLLSSGSKAGRFFSNVSVQSAIATYIIIVCLIYNFFIRSTWAQPFPEILHNNILHVLTPFLYVLRWVIYIPKGSLKWMDSIKWLSFPFAYLIYSLIRGGIIGWYPYFFVDLREISLLEAGRNILLVLLFFILIGMVLVLFDRILGKTKEQGKTIHIF